MFAEFQTPDGRTIFIRRDAVTVVYDTGVNQSVVHTETTGMPVPYSAAHVMEILFPPPQQISEQTFSQEYEDRLRRAMTEGNAWRQALKR